MSVELENNRIFQKLAQRKRVGWSMSFDNIGERFEYVRHGGRWDLLEHNIGLIKQLFAQGQWGGVHAVYNLYNATRLTEFVDWAKGLGIDTHWQSLYQPECLDPLRLGKSVQDLAAAEIKQVLSRSDLTGSERGFFEQAQQNYVSVGHQDVLTPQLVQHVHDMEMVYHTDQQGAFVKLWPELAHLVS
jgi:hypothetical protein